MRDVIIVGGGPAGLTAALYAARAGLDALLLEKNMIGGQMALTTQLDNYPGFAKGVDAVDLCMAMEEQARGVGAEIRYTAAQEIDCAGGRVRTSAGWEEAGALVLALGAFPRKLDVPGEDVFAGRGVSYCATCDGALYRGKRVAVVGGGNTAAEDALYLAGIGCDVLMIHRRDSLRAEQAVANRVLEHPRITMCWNAKVETLTGTDKLETVHLQDGRQEAVSGVFVAIGRMPDTESVRGQIDLDPQGFIVAGEDCKTTAPGVFAAGDVRTKALRQIVTAVGDGAVAVHGLSKV